MIQCEGVVGDPIGILSLSPVSLPHTVVVKETHRDVCQKAHL